MSIKVPILQSITVSIMKCDNRIGYESTKRLK